MRNLTVTDCAKLPNVPKDVEFRYLRDMVDWYITKRKPKLFKAMQTYNTLLDCVTGAPGKNKKRLPDSREEGVPRYKKGSHQRRLTNEVINAFLDKLEPLDLPSKNFSDFESFIDFINAHKPSGIGGTCLYDFCLNYGYKNGFKPEKMVYIHTGPAESVKALQKMKLINVKSIAHRIKLQSLPPEIQELGAEYAEDFLCVFKNHILKLSQKAN